MGCGGTCSAGIARRFGFCLKALRWALTPPAEAAIGFGRFGILLRVELRPCRGWGFLYAQARDAAGLGGLTRRAFKTDAGQYVRAVP